MTTSSENPTNPLWKFMIPAALILALVVGGLMLVKSQIARPPVDSTQKASTEALPDFSVAQFGGKTLKFSELGAKVVLVNFWATWCEACIVEMPSIVALQHHYKDKGFQVVAINVDEKPEAVLPKAVKELGIDFPVYTDPDQKLAELFDVHAIPLTILIDQERKTLFTRNGEFNWNSAEFRARLEGWLAK